MNAMKNGYVICAFAMLFAGLMLAYRWVDWYHTSIFLALLNLIPAIIIGGVALYLRKLNPKTKLWKAVSVVLPLMLISGCIGGCIVLNLFAETMYWHLATITDSRQYAQVLRHHWSGDPAIAHFPKTIPLYARNVRFYSSPGFGQGGTITTLCFTTTPEHIADLYHAFAKPPNIITDDLEKIDISNYFLLYTYDSPGEIPHNFTYIVVYNFINDLFPNRKQTNGIGGIAISKQCNVVVYWAIIRKPF